MNSNNPGDRYERHLPYTGIHGINENFTIGNRTKKFIGSMVFAGVYAFSVKTGIEDINQFIDVTSPESSGATEMAEYIPLIGAIVYKRATTMISGNG